jgi:hypothetical protein
MIHTNTKKEIDYRWALYHQFCALVCDIHGLWSQDHAKTAAFGNYSFNDHDTNTKKENNSVQMGTLPSVP